MADQALRPLGFQTLTVSTAALSLSVPTGVTAAYLTCETNDIRYRVDGNDPTATVGHVLVKGELLIMRGRQILQQIRMIRLGAGDSVLSCTYFAAY
jgi:hypothetical protein